MTGLPAGLAPMLATPGLLPVDDEGWAYEVKWDGVRALGALEGGRLTLTTRRGNDVSSHYPELAGLAGALEGRTVLVDGEIVTVDPQGRTDFGRLQARMHVRSPTTPLLTATPVTYLLFDLLHADGRSLLSETYDARRGALEGLLLDGPHWQVPPAFHGDGAAVAAATRAQGLEGLVAKRRDSRYEPGRRSDNWRKIKHVRRQSAVVVGWQPGTGARSGRLGSLLLAVQGPGGLRYAGHVGTGFTEDLLRVLGDALAPLRAGTSPLAEPAPAARTRATVWVRPELVADVDFTEWTREGRLRHPSFKGLRDDLDPADVVREP